MTQYLDSCHRSKEGACHGRDGDSGGCLTGAGAFENRTGVVEAVFLHSHKVRVPGSRSGQRCVAREIGEN
jgi:hypothetical protein